MRLLCAFLLSIVVGQVHAGALPHAVPAAVPLAVPEAVPEPSLGTEYKSAAFDSDDYVSMTNAKSGGALDFGTGSWTISVWVWRATGEDDAAIFDKGGDIAAAQSWISLQIVTGKARLDLYNSAQGTVRKTAATTLPEQEWFHLVFVADRIDNEICIYLNGVEDLNSAFTAGGESDNDQPADLGVRRNEGTPNTLFLDGRIGPLRVWNGTGLTAPQAAAQFANTKPYGGPDPDPDLAFGLQSGPDGLTIIPYIGEAIFSFPVPESNRPAFVTEGTSLPPTSE